MPSLGPFPGLSPHSQRPCQRQYTHERSPCPLQHASAFLDSCSRGHNIVDNHDPRAGQIAAGPNSESAADVPFAGRRAEMAL